MTFPNEDPLDYDPDAAYEIDEDFIAKFRDNLKKIKESKSKVSAEKDD